MAKKKKEKIKLASSDLRKVFGPWHWPLAVNSELEEDIARNTLLRQNPDFTPKEQTVFIEAVYQSISLDKQEKKRVLDAYPTLSKFQFKELLKVWREEETKFAELEEDHSEEVFSLTLRTQAVWGALVNPLLGTIKLLSILSKLDIKFEIYSQFVLKLMQNNAEDENFHTNCIIGEFYFNSIQDEDLNLAKRKIINAVINIYAYSAVIEYKIKLDDVLYKKIIFLIKRFDIPNKDDLVNIIILYIIQLNGLEDVDNLTMKRILETLNSFTQNMSLTKSYISFLQGNEQDSLNLMLARLRFGAEDQEEFKAKIKDNIYNLDDDDILSYIEYFSFFLSTYEALMKRNIMYGSGSASEDINKIAIIIDSVIKKMKKPYIITHLKKLDYFYMISNFHFSDRPSYVHKENELSDVLKWVRNNHFNPEIVMKFFNEIKINQKIEIYKVIFPLYVQSMRRIDHGDIMGARVVQEGCLVVFDMLHERRSITLNKEERDKMQGYLRHKTQNTVLNSEGEKDRLLMEFAKWINNNK